MKTLLRSSEWKLMGVAILAGLIAFLAYGKRLSPVSAGPKAGPALQMEEASPAEPIQQLTAKGHFDKRVVADQQLLVKSVAPPQTSEPPLTSEQALDLLASPRTTYAQRQTLWKRFSDPEQLEKAIADLEERVKNDPQVANYSAVLGTAYLRRAGQTRDVREQAILGMKADQTFDTAINTDPGNWEARYMKAVGMSYWPAQMNKGTEVLERFTSLIQDQEQQSPQPEFSQSYLRLGDEYRKAGRREEAQQVWQRGAALFPNDPELKRKLASIQ